MKKVSAVLAGIVALTVIAMGAGLNTYDNSTVTTLLDPIVLKGTSSTGTVVNVGPYKGIATVILAVSDPVDNLGTNIVTVQHSTASDGTFTTVTNEAGTAVTDSIISTAAGDLTILKIDTATMHQYIRAVGTANGSTGSVSAVIITPK